jgi:hypothetical protein
MVIYIALLMKLKLKNSKIIVQRKAGSYYVVTRNKLLQKKAWVINPCHTLKICNYSALEWNAHLWPILNEKLSQKCSFTMLCRLRFFYQFFVHPWLTAERCK